MNCSSLFSGVNIVAMEHGFDQKCLKCDSQMLFKIISLVCDFYTQFLQRSVSCSLATSRRL